LIPDTAAALSLLSAEAVRTRAHRMLAMGLADRLPHFRVNSENLEIAADLVVAATKAAYPSVDVPFHSRWRHFAFDGENRWASLDAATNWKDRASRARAAFDLAIVSVLLDGGAGPEWHYRDPGSGEGIGRSEGLALASFAMFADGRFSSDGADPLRVDADALARLSDSSLMQGFQVTPQNPLPGLQGRAALLRQLGRVVLSSARVFGRSDEPRPGGLFDLVAEIAHGSRVAAPVILSNVLRHFGSIWPSRITLGGVPLGDCWRYPLLKTGDATDGLVPLHKLSQWLTYSLVEPIEAAGIAVTDIGGLTGLAEYRNGGLFMDTGALELRHPAEAHAIYDVSSTLVVEWRALTVALLDELANIVRRRLGFDASSFPLAKMLEGGTWAAGRKIARELRADGSSPLRVVSDGTVF
jgi:uncharacterized protein DUF1688